MRRAKTTFLQTAKNTLHLNQYPVSTRKITPQLRAQYRLLHYLTRSGSLLVFVGIIMGFTTTMCLQSFNCLPAAHCQNHNNQENHNAQYLNLDNQEVFHSKRSISQHRRRSINNNRSKSINQHKKSIVDVSMENQNQNEKLVLVGVMTAQKYVNSRAYNVWRTWAQTIPGEFYTFVAEQTETEHLDMPLVRLPAVDDSYPPQKKSFVMLKAMADYGVDKFDWFIRADDDLYVRTDKLEALLRSLDPNKPLYIGQAGQGTSAEYGTLSLADNENYCMGGPGVVLSRAAMKLLQPHLTSCLGNMLTSHEDVEVGRCVRKHVKVSCTWSYEMQQIFHNNRSGEKAFSGDLNVAEVHSAVSLHPVKRPELMLRLHNFVRGLKADDLRMRHLQLSRDLADCQNQIQSMKGFGADQVDTQNEHVEFSSAGLQPSLMKHQPKDTNELLHWDFINAQNILFCTKRLNCPRHNVESYWKYASQSVIRQIFEYFNRNARQRGRLLSFQSVQYGYRRVNPLYGVDYVLDMILLFRKFKGRRATVAVRRHAYAQQAFAPAIFIDHHKWLKATDNDTEPAILPESVHQNGHPSQMDQQPPVAVIHFVLPLAGRLNTFRRFMSNFEDVCLKVDGRCHLNVVMFASNSTGTDQEIRALVQTTQLRYADSAGFRLQLTEMAPTQPFSRGLALTEGAQSLRTLVTDPLLLLTDVDIVFSKDALHRIRCNTVPARQVYYPVVFSEFADEQRAPRPPAAPKPTYADWQAHLHDFSGRQGYFRHFGFGIVSVYRSDLSAVGGLATDIQGWGMEDVDLFEKFVKHPVLDIFRAPDPSLVHVYHPVVCDRLQLPEAQYKMCLGSKSASYGGTEHLADQVRHLWTEQRSRLRTKHNQRRHVLRLRQRRRR